MNNKFDSSGFRMDRNFSKPFTITDEPNQPIDFLSNPENDTRRGLYVGKMVFDHDEKTVSMNLGNCPFLLDKGITPDFKQSLMGLE